MIELKLIWLGFLMGIGVALGTGLVGWLLPVIGYMIFKNKDGEE